MPAVRRCERTEASRLLVLQHWVGRPRRVAALWVASWAPLLVGSPALQAAPGTSETRLGQFSVDTWSIRNGLPSGRVRAVAQTPDGYLWLLTTGGLVRFDGVRFAAAPELQEALHTEVVVARALLVARDGALWIGGQGFLCRLKDGRATVYPTVFDVSSLAESADGSLWMGHEGQGLHRLLKDGQLLDSTPAAIPPIRALHEDGQRRLWMGGLGDALYSLADGKLTRHAVRDGLSDVNVNAIVGARDGSVWIATRAGLNRFAQGRFEVSRQLPVSAEVVALHEDRQGFLWAGTSAGKAYRLRAGSSEAVLRLEGHAEDGVLCLTEDREGSIWIGTTDGLARLRPGKFMTYTRREGLAGDRAAGIIEGRDGTIWVFSDGGGISTIRGDVIRRVTERDGLASNYGGPLYEARDGSIWAGTANGLSCIQGDRVRSYSRGLLARRFVSAMVEDESGLIVALPLVGLFRFTSGALTPYIVKDVERIRTRYVYQALRLADGSIALAMGNGLALIRQGQLRIFTREDGLLDDNIRSVYEARDGVLWLATGKVGIARLKDGRVLTLTARQGLHDDRVYRVLDDAQGDLWLSCPRGLFRVSRGDLEEFAAGRRSAVRSVVFGVADGMQTDECSFGAQPPGCKARDGSLWFPTFRGVVSIDPSHLRTNTLAPPVIVEGLVVNDRPRRPTEALELEPGVERLEFHFAGLSLLVPEKVEFRYRLEGFDPDWVHVGGRRAAYYTKIPPGRYRFRVTAANNDGVWNENGAALAFSVKPGFRQMPAFALLLGLVAALAMWGLYRLRIYEVQKRYAAVLGERSRIAREMHDTLAQNLGGVALQLDSVKKQFRNLPSELKDKLDETSRMIRYSLAEAYGAIRNLRTQWLETQPLPVALERLAQRATANTDLLVRMEVTGAPSPLSAVTENNVLRIFQEAVGNVVKHAGARHVDVSLRFEVERLLLAVHDDGHGFDAEQAFSLAHGHYGLIGMQERVDRIGGRLTLTSAAGAGTEIRIEVPNATTEQGDASRVDAGRRGAQGSRHGRDHASG